MDSKNNLSNKRITQYNKYDLLFFPRIDSKYKENRSVISYFAKKGHRIFYFNINIGNELNGELDRENKNVVIVTLEKEKFDSINYKLDEIIKKGLIKDCVIVVEDPSWQSFIIYLKKIYGFKVIFNYSEEFVGNSTNKTLDFKYDDRILDISDRIIIFSPKLHYNKVIKNDGVDIINVACTPEHIERAIKEIHGLVSIVIVTFNNLAFTKQCIYSIFSKTAYPNYEIIVVDNNSEDETPAYLKSLQMIYPNISVILNKKNTGFAKANNLGILHAKGDYIILLNNDTIVTKGWITGFIKHLERNDTLGMIGPVTNGSPNESKIDANYASIKEMDAFAEKYTSINLNKLYWNLRMLLMFCVAMKRKIINEVGYLDESFGIGMFEDDDYSYRIKLKGYKIACAEDVFIHHYGSVSLGKLERFEYGKLFLRNKHIYEEKWNTIWLGHQFRR